MQRESQLTNAALMARRKAAIPRGVGQSHEVFIARGENAEVWDVEGKRYIDFAGGIAVLNTGHRHPTVIAAVKAQLDLYTVLIGLSHTPTTGSMLSNCINLGLPW